MRLAAFLAFSVLSGFLEIGIILDAALGTDPFTNAALMALAYQIGTLVPLPFAVTQKVARGLSVCGAGLALALIAIPVMPIQMVLVVVLSAIINLSRMELGKAQVPTTLKRSFRVAGFLASPLLTLPLALPITAFGVVALGATMIWSYRPADHAGRDLPMTAMTGALVAHQMHYFSYYGAVVAVLAMAYGPFYAAIGFALGWISYISTPHLAGRMFPPETLVIGGHICLSVVLAALATATPGGWIWLLLWILTGFFGGTVVYLTRLAHQRFGFDEFALTGTENSGHALGAVVACLWLAAGGAPGSLFLIAALFALTTAGFVARAVGRSRVIGISAP